MLHHSDFCSLIQFWLNVCYYTNVLYSSEFQISVCRLSECGGVSPKYVGVNKRLHCCVCYMCIFWFYKREISHNALYE